MKMLEMLDQMTSWDLLEVEGELLELHSTKMLHCQLHHINKKDVLSHKKKISCLTGNMAQKSLRARILFFILQLLILIKN